MPRIFLPLELFLEPEGHPQLSFLTCSVSFDIQMSSHSWKSEHSNISDWLALENRENYDYL